MAYLTFPHALKFLDNIGGPSLHQILDPTKYLSLIVLMMTVFGLTFEFPVLLVSLELAGVLTPEAARPRGGAGPSCSSWWWPGSSPRARTRSR